MRHSLVASIASKVLKILIFLILFLLCQARK